MKLPFRTLAAVAAATLGTAFAAGPGVLHAQTIGETAVASGASVVSWPRALGGEFSFLSVGLNYQHAADGGACFHNLSLGVGLTDVVLGRSDIPGVYTSYSYCYNLASWEKGSGRLEIFAGPGVYVGYGTDIDRKIRGAIVGPKADIGLRYGFRGLPVAISASLQPTLAAHISQSSGPEGAKFGIYTAGLIESVIPKVTLSWALDGKGSGNDSDGSSLAGNASETGSWASEDGVLAGEIPQPRYSRRPIVTFGAEWGWSPAVFLYDDFNYISEEGYREIYRDGGLTFISSGYLLANFGFDIGRHVNISLYSGIRGISREQRIIPLELRASWLFGEPEARGRWMTFLQGGYGFRASPQLISGGVIASVGAGYRLRLGSLAMLDFIFSVDGLDTHPDIYYGHESIEIRRGDEMLGCLSFGLGLNF